VYKLQRAALPRTAIPLLTTGLLAAFACSKSSTQGAPASTVNDLRGSYVSSDAAGGQATHVFSITNESPKGCHLVGPLTVRFVDAQGNSPRTQVNSESDNEQNLLLQVGESASFFTRSRDVPVEGETCPVAGAVRITPRGSDTQELVIPLQIDDQRGAFTVCPSGTIVVSALSS
jgi:uncharacterized protein DUF4232